MNQEKIEALANIIYCYIPANYDGSNPEQVREVCERTARAVIQWFKEEVVPKNKETKPSTEADEISFLEDVNIMGYNEAIKDTLTNLTKEE
jgi:50S ribosomal subunit-associated GTPase HflX